MTRPLQFRRVVAALLLAGTAMLPPATLAADVAPRLGVFYFPGWKDDAPGLAHPKPWEPIKAYPEREPMLGWYDEGRVEVMEQHLTWMADHGLSFVVFDWYWGGGRAVLDHALTAYAASPGKRRVPYALMWANHGGAVQSEADLASMFDELVGHHFQQPEYLKIDGRPLLFVMVPENLERNAASIGVTSADLTARLQAVARRAGLPGVLLLAGAGGGVNAVTRNARRWGYGAYFEYNYSAGMAGTRGEARGARSYAELDEVYREHWNWFMGYGDLPYVVPMTSGWDMRPWGGSADPKRDLSVSTVKQFVLHLKSGREVIQRHYDKTLGLGVLCCWNEFGEGSYVEPTKLLGTRYLDAIRSVFLPP